MTEPGRSPGTRSNGLPCAGYTPLADLDPRVADALLQTLRDAGIAAYAAPTPAAAGGYMELRLPNRPVDRLWVDHAERDRARDILAAEGGTGVDTPATDFDAAWRGVLDSLRAPEGDAVRPWPAREDLAPESADTLATAAAAEPDEPDEHYDPPPPPPLPRLRPVTVSALAAIVAGFLVLVTGIDGGSLQLLGVTAVVAGVVALVWNMRNGPPTDSGWDDGAVV